MNIQKLEKAVRTLRFLGENDLADEVWNIMTLYLYTEDDKNDEDYVMESESSDEEL